MATSNTWGLSEAEKRLVIRDRQRKAAELPGGNAGKLSVEADAAPTILAREMTLRGSTSEKVAQKTTLHKDRVAAIASGKAAPRPDETPALERHFGLSGDLLTSPNTPENRAAVNKARPLC